MTAKPKNELMQALRAKRVKLGLVPISADIPKAQKQRMEKMPGGIRDQAAIAIDKYLAELSDND